MAVIQEHAKKRIKEIVASHKDEPTPLLVVLSQIQQEFGYIPLEVQEVVSEERQIHYRRLPRNRLLCQRQSKHYR